MLAGRGRGLLPWTPHHVAVAERRGVASVQSIRGCGLRLVQLAVVGLLTLLLAACGSSGGASTASAPSADRTVKVNLLDEMKFIPATFEVRAGQIVRVELTNKGVLVHDFVIRDLEKVIKAEVGGGKKGVASFTAPAAPGAYEFVCVQPGHEQAGMKGLIRVTA